MKLPAGKTLVPGVVSHATDLVEHPEIVWAKLTARAEGAALASGRLWK